MIDASGSGIYSIGAVSRMLGLERATIRNWEERFGQVVPERSPGGQRLFSREDLDRLRFVAGLMADGMSPSAAHERLAKCLAQGRLLETDGKGPEGQLMVLLAERDRLAADLTEFYLRTEGYDVVSVFDAEQARSQHGKLRPELAIVDLLIDAGSGLSLCTSLKQAGLPALLAISTLETREAALDAGSDAFLLKPVDPLRLVSTVKDLLGTGVLATSAAGESAGSGSRR